MTETKTEIKTYTYRAPSGCIVISCFPDPGEDPWLRFGAIGYGLHSYWHWGTVIRKDFRKTRAARRKARAEK